MRYASLDHRLFKDNRRRFCQNLKKNSLAVFTSNDTPPTSADGMGVFIQNSDFFYLSGIDQEESILVLFPDAPEEKHREILFLRKTDKQIAIWEGQKLSFDEAFTISGIRTVYWTSQFESIFRMLVCHATRIYLNSNEHDRASSPVETRQDRFCQWCQNTFRLHRYRRSAPILHHLRAVKSTFEIDLIRKACKITEKALRRVLGFIRPGVWEFEIEAEIWHEFLINRSRRHAYLPIIASGANACVLHYINNDRQCRKGELVLMDFGAEYANYTSDLTRTVPVSGRFTKRQRQVYDSVLNVQRKAIKLLSPGMTLETYHAEVGHIVTGELIGLGLLDPKRVAAQNKDNPLYKKYFMHGTSHLLGLDVHDVGNRYRVFEAGMVFTCEPGIYIPQEEIGVRIETDIWITADGPKDLMQDVPVDPEEIEALMNEHK